MATQLDLIMNAKNAPAELTAAVAAHQKNYDALNKAVTKAKEAKTAQLAAEAEFNKTNEVYQRLLNAWEIK